MSKLIKKIKTDKKSTYEEDYNELLNDLVEAKNAANLARSEILKDDSSPFNPSLTEKDAHWVINKSIVTNVGKDGKQKKNAYIRREIIPFNLSSIITVVGLIFLFVYSFSENVAFILFALVVFAAITAHILERIRSKEPFICKYLIGISVALCIAALWIFVSYLIYLTAHFLRKF